MYEVKEGTRTLRGVEIVTWAREIWNCNALRVEVGTTGYEGGDSGHGGRTYFRLEDLTCTDIKVNTTHDGYANDTGVEIMLGGDCELATFIEALEWSVKVLKKEIKAQRGGIRV